MQGDSQQEQGLREALMRLRLPKGSPGVGTAVGKVPRGGMNGGEDTRVKPSVNS